MHGATPHECTLDPDYMEFSNSETFSQFVISESAATCMMNSFASSEIGQIQLNKHSVNLLFGMDHLNWNTTFIAPQIPLFEEKLGADVPLKLTLHWKDIKVLFGQFDSDVILEYTVCLSWKMDLLGSKEFLYDELKMITSLDLKMADDRMFIRLLNHKLDVDSKFGQKSKPIRNTLDITDNEYKEFLSTYGFSMNYLKKWMNDNYFFGGIDTPYNVEEFQTKVQFKEKSMHFLLEVEEDADQYFDDIYNRVESPS